MRRKKKRISDFTNFATDFTDKYTRETPTDINLPNYLDEEDEQKRKIKEMEEERIEKDENMEESLTPGRRLRRFNETSNDELTHAAEYAKELLWEFGDDIQKSIEIDSHNNLSILIRPKREPFNSLEDIKTGQAIRIGEDFVERLASMSRMLKELGLVNVFEVTWTNVTEKGNRTRRKTIVEPKNLDKTIKLIKDKPIAQVRITAGKPR